MKRLKQILLLLLFAILAILILAIGVSFAMKDQILNKARVALSEQLDTEIAVSRLDMNPIAHFPLVTVIVDGLIIEDNNQESLLKAKQLELLFSPFHLKGDKLKIKELILSQGELNISRKGDQWNFQFSEASSESKSIQLESLELKDIQIAYSDDRNQSELELYLDQYEGNFVSDDVLNIEGLLQITPQKIFISEKEWSINEEMAIDLKFQIDFNQDKDLGEGRVKIKTENADLDLTLDGQILELNGDIESEVLNAMNTGYQFDDGSIHLSRILYDNTQGWSQAEGSLRLRNIDFKNEKQSYTLSSKGLNFSKDSIHTDNLKLEFGESEMIFEGALLPRDSFYYLNGKLNSDELHVDDVFNMLQDSTEGKSRFEGSFEISVDELEYGKWKAKNVIGQIDMSKNLLDYDLEMRSFSGEMKAEGFLKEEDGFQFTSKASFRDMETEEMLDQLDNLGQSFITSDHLSGELSGNALIDFYLNLDHSINADKSKAQIAMNFDNGRLRDFEMLEEFSKYVSMDDLMDVKFQKFSNLMEWRGNHLSIPMIFINNNAANFTISGFHDSENQFVYNLQLNASDVLARKLGKKRSSARRKGWWNMYYVIEGNTDDFEMDSDKQKVKASFQRSKLEKRRIFKTLLTSFGNTPVLQDLNDWNLQPDAQ